MVIRELHRSQEARPHRSGSLGKTFNEILDRPLFEGLSLLHLFCQGEC